MKRMKVFLLLFLTSFVYAAEENSLYRFEFLTQDAKKITLKEYKDTTVFLSFVFTRCPMPEMCPLTIHLNKKLSKLWKRSVPSVPLKHVLVTLDPRFDSPSVLKKYKVDVGLGASHFVFLTGNTKTLSDFAAEFNVIAFPEKDSLSHNLKSILLVPELQTVQEFKDNSWKPEDVVNAFKKWSESRQKRG